MLKYLIKLTDGTLATKEPTIGTWYCEMTECYDYAHHKTYTEKGSIGQYVGDDQFYDGANAFGPPVKGLMNDHDYLLEMHNSPIT